MKRENLYISSIDQKVLSVANEYELGIEVAEFCTAINMDTNFEMYDEHVREYVAKSVSGRFTFHAPFNELSPAAIDPFVLKVTKYRYKQAIKLANSYNIKRIIVHSGFTPDAYFPVWFEGRSIEFWNSFFDEVPGDYEILLENVFERTPEQLAKIVDAVDNNRLKLCFDIGHANVVADNKDMLSWLKVYGNRVGHFHIHNNNGDFDQHANLAEGNIPINKLLDLASDICPNATYTIETLDSEPSVLWLLENNYIK